MAKAEEARNHKIVRDALTKFRKRMMRICAERSIPFDVIHGDLRELFEEARKLRISLDDKSNLTRDLMDELATELRADLIREHADVTSRSRSILRRGTTTWSLWCRAFATFNTASWHSNALPTL